MKWIDEAPRHLFFTGKGGVGKTSLAAASAVTLADRGRRVLLVSTDPASNLDDVLGVPLGREPTPVPGVPDLEALNIDPEAAAEAYRDRVVGPVRDVLPEEAVAGIEEQLSGACTVEVAAFDEFTMLLGADGAAAAFDHVVFDTAPTGHTLRLLRLPAAWSEFLDTNEHGASCLGPSSGLKMQHERYAATVRALSDPERTLLVMVTRPEAGALNEAARSSEELGQAGLRNQHLVINGVFEATDPADELATALEEGGRRALARLPEALRDVPSSRIPLRGENIVGLAAIRGMLDPFRNDGTEAAEAASAHAGELPPLPSATRSLETLTDRLQARERGLVMVMGKGGVGKTTIAAALAAELARRGVAVHLTTTDPAAHVADVVGETGGSLRVTRIDPEAEVEAYRARVLARAGKDLDDEGRALLEEDLRSPCTEEVAVFHAFSKIVSGARRELVIMDTAPTGHTLLLLDAAGSYHREIMRNATVPEGAITTPLMRLRDPEFTRVLLVTLAETTPVLEAAALADDLRRAGIEPYGWVVNNSLAAAGPSDPLLRRRAGAEVEQIRRVATELAERTYVVPRLADEPRGAEALRTMIDRGPATRPAA
ncbi:MAG: arsenical pump-driving ATPase [Gemmatimonadota bacterium]